MVGEFPELQGIMGRYYATKDGEDTQVALAIAAHYQPTQSGGELPGTRIGQCVAIADKLDTLAGLFGIGQPPTGSRDPFALRRQALGVIRICIEGQLPLDLASVVNFAASLHKGTFETVGLIAYLFERLAGTYQDQGVPVDTVNAVRAGRDATTILTEFDKKVRAVQQFRNDPAASALVAANKRVANMLKQIDANQLPKVSPALFSIDAESALYDRLVLLQGQIADLPAYEDRLGQLAELQPVIDRYFDDVMVMDDDAATRTNRIATLAAMRNLFMNVADVSELQL